MLNDKQKALIKHVVEEYLYSAREAIENIESIEEDYKVYTNDEANEAWDDSLDSYIEDCILPEIPEQYRFYFDCEGWKSDAESDGRGHSLSCYDGKEYEEEVNGETYYIYRIN